MCVAVIGELGADGWGYREAAQRAGFELWCLNGKDVDLAASIKSLDAMVVMPEGVSAEEREAASRIAARRNIPLMCATCEGKAACGGAQKRCVFSCSAAKNLK